VAAKKKSGGRKYGKGASKTVASAMRRRKKGTLRSGKGGKGGKVKSRKQAISYNVGGVKSFLSVLTHCTPKSAISL
jgi:hypothetical protein